MTPPEDVNHNPQNQEPDVLKELQDQGRRLRVARMLPDGTLPPRLAHQVIDDFYAFLEKHHISLAQVSRELGKGFSVSVLSTLKSAKTGKYVGNLERIVRGVNDWMEQHVRRSEAPMPGGFVETEVANRMMDIARNIQATNSIGVIHGPAGVGKTMVCDVLVHMLPGTIYLRTRRKSRSDSALLRRIADELGVTVAARRANLSDLEDAVINKLKGSNRLLIFDEAHQLTADAIELLRDLHDEAGVPILLVGTIDLEKKVTDTGMFYGQLHSRILMHYDITEEARNPKRGGRLYSLEQIRGIFCQGKIRLTDDGEAFLHDICNAMGLGCLRTGMKIMTTAALVCDGKPINAKLIRQVIRKLRGTHLSSVLADEIERRMDKAA